MTTLPTATKSKPTKAQLEQAWREYLQHFPTPFTTHEIADYLGTEYFAICKRIQRWDIKESDSVGRTKLYSLAKAVRIAMLPKETADIATAMKRLEALKARKLEKLPS